MTAPSHFSYEALPMRVRFGSGTLKHLEEEVHALGLSRVLVLSTPGQRALAQGVSDSLGGVTAGVFHEAKMHVPIEVAARARDLAERLGADGCVAVGGGSTIGLGKALALQFGMPIIAVPTTYAGSEMTPIWGLTEAGRKRTGRDERVLPRSVLYDPDLTASLPVGISVTSGINAIAHAVEALYAPDGSPIISLMAEEGIRSLVAALPGIVADLGDPVARAGALYGAWFCGACLGSTTMSLHHKICHSLGGTLDLPHAQTHTVVLPHALAYNRASAPFAVQAISRALGGVADPAAELARRARDWGAPTSLRELGMRYEDIATIVTEVLAKPYANPRPVTEEGLTALLTDAWHGHDPRSS